MKLAGALFRVKALQCLAIALQVLFAGCSIGTIEFVAMDPEAVDMRNYGVNSLSLQYAAGPELCIPITVNALDASAQPAPVKQDLVIDLQASITGGRKGKFYTSPKCTGAQLTEGVIPAGQMSKTYYVLRDPEDLDVVQTPDALIEVAARGRWASKFISAERSVPPPFANPAEFRLLYPPFADLPSGSDEPKLHLRRSKVIHGRMYLYGRTSPAPGYECGGEWIPNENVAGVCRMSVARIHADGTPDEAWGAKTGNVAPALSETWAKRDGLNAHSTLASAVTEDEAGESVYVAGSIIRRQVVGSAYGVGDLFVHKYSISGALEAVRIFNVTSDSATDVTTSNCPSGGCGSREYPVGIFVKEGRVYVVGKLIQNFSDATVEPGAGWHGQRHFVLCLSAQTLEKCSNNFNGNAGFVTGLIGVSATDLRDAVMGNVRFGPELRSVILGVGSCKNLGQPFVPCFSMVDTSGVEVGFENLMLQTPPYVAPVGASSVPNFWVNQALPQLNAVGELVGAYFIGGHATISVFASNKVSKTDAYLGRMNIASQGMDVSFGTFESGGSSTGYSVLSKNGSTWVDTPGTAADNYSQWANGMVFDENGAIFVVGSNAHSPLPSASYSHQGTWIAKYTAAGVRESLVDHSGQSGVLLQDGVMNVASTTGSSFFAVLPFKDGAAAFDISTKRNKGHQAR